ncbi:hypothetical protein MPSEU_000820600 [Mayamaea pseudoterrestris]|nr:hypothetical protein MPSEU_000820600 [Mayamaea pseudoterrestris]
MSQVNYESKRSTRKHVRHDVPEPAGLMTDASDSIKASSISDNHSSAVKKIKERSKSNADAASAVCSLENADQDAKNSISLLHLDSNAIEQVMRFLEIRELAVLASCSHMLRDKLNISGYLRLIAEALHAHTGRTYYKSTAEKHK